MANHSRKQRAAGFTLIEIAVVVALIGIMLTAGLKIAGALLESAANTTTAKRQQAIKDALISYLGRNNRLPCPDTGPPGNTAGINAMTPGQFPDGVENRVTAGNPASNCAAAFGVVPYVTLGLPREAVLDGWENFFGYQIAQIPGNTWVWATTPAGAPNLYPEVNPGNITVNDLDPTSGSPIQLTNQAVVVLISYGRNGLGAYTIAGTANTLPSAASETTNASQAASPSAPGNVVYYSRQPTDNPAAQGGPIDDIVMFLTASDLVTPLYQANVLISPIAGMNQEFATIRNAVLAFAVAQAGACSGSPNPSVNIPSWSNLTSVSQPILPANFPTTDPWGRQWSSSYVPNPRGNVDRTDTGAAVTLTSGPSGTTTSIISSSDIQGAMASWYATCTSIYCAQHPSSCTPSG